MKEHVREKWDRSSGHLILFTADKWTLLWRIGYETDALTGSPPYVNVSLGGEILSSNVRTPPNRE